MDYSTYMASSAWREKRRQRLALDGHKCRLCDHDGAKWRLEVHHRPSCYVKIPHESIEDDLITLCARCHAFVTATIRKDRAQKQPKQPFWQMDKENVFSLVALTIIIVFLIYFIR